MTWLRCMRPVKAPKNATFMEILEGEDDDGGEVEKLKSHIEWLRTHVDAHFSELKREVTLYRSATKGRTG